LPASPSVYDHAAYEAGLTCRCLRRTSIRGATTVPFVPFFKAPPATVVTDFNADATDCLTGIDTGALTSGEGVLDLELSSTIDGPASGSVSFSESEESNSDDEASGCVDRRFGFQSACFDDFFFFPFVGPPAGTALVASPGAETVSSMICSFAFPLPFPRTSSSLLLSLPSPCFFLSLSIPFLTTRSSRPSSLSLADVGARGVCPSVAEDRRDREVPLLGASAASSWIFLSRCSS
jgi:hypothetical protein